MKDCLFIVLLLAIISNAFEETSFFSTTSKAEINTTESIGDYKSEINALSYQLKITIFSIFQFDIYL